MTNVYVMVHCATVALRTLHGPLPLPAVVAIKQTLEIFFTLILGAANVTAFLQVVLILKPRWVQVLLGLCNACFPSLLFEAADEKIMKMSMIAVCLHASFNLVEIVLVGCPLCPVPPCPDGSGGGPPAGLPLQVPAPLLRGARHPPPPPAPHTLHQGLAGGLGQNFKV